MNLLNIFDHSPAQKVITIMYVLVIMALYFEHLAGAALVVFVVSMIWLFFQKPECCQLGRIEKNWIIISLIYSCLILSSFFIHQPITSDGVWRLSSYAFIILMTGFFYIQSKIVITREMIFLIMLFSIICSFAIFLIELGHYGLNIFTNTDIRMGHYASVNYGGYANFTMGSLIVLLSIYAFNLSKPQKVFLILLTISMLMFIVLGRGRTSIWYFSILVVAMSWFYYQKCFSLLSKKRLLSLMGVAVFSIVSVFAVTHERIYAAYHDIYEAVENNYDSSLGHRIVMYTIAADIISDHPLLGVGLNKFKESKEYYIDKHNFNLSQEEKARIVGYTQIHNQFLMDAIFFGLFGFVAVCFFIFYPLVMYFYYYRAYHELDFKLISLVGILFIGYEIFTSLFGSIFTYTYTSIFYMLINALLINYLSQSIKNVRGS